MTKIKLLGNLHPELTLLGLRFGDEVEATFLLNNQANQMYFQKIYNGFSVDCVVLPDHFEILSDEKREVNGYSILFNPYWKEYQISHPQIGANIASFKFPAEAINYCNCG
jgi:hypothetical protein